MICPHGEAIILALDEACLLERRRCLSVRVRRCLYSFLFASVCALVRVYVRVSGKERERVRACMLAITHTCTGYTELKNTTGGPKADKAV